METPANLVTFLPYTFLAIIPAVVLIFLIKKHQQSNPKTRNCPHCRAAGNYTYYESIKILLTFCVHQLRDNKFNIAFSVLTV